MFFSIIVVSLNAESTIGKTIESVLKQDFNDYEIIVKDGFSKDRTLEMLPKDDKIKVYQTADTGIYDAMNQAIRLSSGKFLLFLNCGDCLIDNRVLSKVYQASDTLEDCPAIVYGDYCRKGVKITQYATVSWFNLYRTHLTHQTMFFTKKLFDRVGLYNLKYRICADHEYTVRAYQRGTEFLHIPIVICDYQGDGVSETEKGIEKAKKEQKEIEKKYYSTTVRWKYNIILFLTFRKLRKKLTSDNTPEWVRKGYFYIIRILNDR